MYGITETTVHVTYKEIGISEVENDSREIGRPIPTLTTLIFDKHMNLVPHGVKGELFVGGDGVSRGYLNKPELTAKKFIQNPHNPKEKLYRTGDVASINKNDMLEYHGRIDKQVQVRGFRIELEEVERHLLKYNGVENTVVVDRTNADDQVVLCAYLVSNEDIDISDLRLFLSNRIPQYMIPAHMTQIEEIPQTSNGKVNKKMLPNIEVTDDSDYEAPTNEEEKQMERIWSGILGIDELSVNANFFNLGGDSIIAIKLINAIRTEMNVQVEIADLFTQPTIRGMVNVVADAESFSKELKIHDQVIDELNEFKIAVLNDYERSVTENIEDVYPAADIQSGMIFHSLKESGNVS